MQGKTPLPCVWIAGGNGFVGHAIGYQLKTKGHPVNLLSRADSVQADFNMTQTDYSLSDLQRRFNENDIVINLIGILNEKGYVGNGFIRAHVDTTRVLCQAARTAGVTRFLQMSALNANTHGPSHYLTSKALAEKVVMESGLDYTIFRPSVIFGPLDSFINRFAQLLRVTPYLFPLACPNARFQPVYVEDVAACFAQSITLPETVSQCYELGGPDIYTLREIVTLISATLGKPRKIIPLNQHLSKLQAAILQFVPGKPFSLDNYKSLQIDSVCKDNKALPFELSPTRLSESIKMTLS